MAKSAIQSWLDSKGRDYAAGVKLYAAHPTAQRGLVNTFQRKPTKFAEEKLVYCLEKADASDKDGSAAELKKKGQGSVKGKSKPKKAAQKKKAAPPPKAPSEEEE